MSEALRPEERDAAEAALAQRTNERIVAAEAWAEERGITAPPEQSAAKAAALQHKLNDMLSDKRRKGKAASDAPVADMTRRQQSTESASASWSFDDQAPAAGASAPSDQAQEPASEPAFSPSQVDPETGEILAFAPTDAGEEPAPAVDQADDAGLYGDPFESESSADFGAELNFGDAPEQTAGGDEFDWTPPELSESVAEPESEPLPFPSGDEVDSVDPFAESPSPSPIIKESPRAPESALESEPTSSVEQELDDVWAALVREEGQPESPP